MRKEFDFDTNNLVDSTPIDTSVVRERIYTELGTDNIILRFRGDADRTPIVEMDTLPQGVQESDIKNAIQKSHPRADGDPT